MGSRPTSGTSSRSSRSSPENAGDVRAHTAAHVLKGAVTSVLGPRLFTFVQAGVVKVRSERPLTPQEVGKIEAAANREVAEDVAVTEFEMERQEAEGHFGTGIYDFAKAPAAGGLLRMVRIPDWEASFCTLRHVESTGSVGAMRIDSAEFDERRGEVELRFHLL